MGCAASLVAKGAGGLLPRLFTLTSPGGRRLFSVTYPRRRRRLPVRKHGALCCPDFPLEDPVFKRQTTLLRKAFRCVQPCLFFALAKEIIMSTISSSLMLEASIER